MCVIVGLMSYDRLYWHWPISFIIGCDHITCLYHTPYSLVWHFYSYSWLIEQGLTHYSWSKIVIHIYQYMKVTLAKILILIFTRYINFIMHWIKLAFYKINNSNNYMYCIFTDKQILKCTFIYLYTCTKEIICQLWPVNLLLMKFWDCIKWNLTNIF